MLEEHQSEKKQRVDIKENEFIEAVKIIKGSIVESKEIFEPESLKKI